MCTMSVSSLKSPALESVSSGSSSDADSVRNEAVGSERSVVLRKGSVALHSKQTVNIPHELARNVRLGEQNIRLLHLLPWLSNGGCDLLPKLLESEHLGAGYVPNVSILCCIAVRVSQLEVLLQIVSPDTRRTRGAEWTSERYIAAG